MSIRLLVGLGNPGPRYAETRHNVGFWVADRLAQEKGVSFHTETRFFGEVCRLDVHGEDTRWLIKPTTFMNHSGRAVASLAAFYKIAFSELLVIHDDLDLPVGVVRLKQGGGHGGHNGLRDIIAHCGAGFWRVRLGIGHPGSARAVVDYVLDRPSRADEALIHDGIDPLMRVMGLLYADEFQKAMNQLHGNPLSRSTPLSVVKP